MASKRCIFLAGAPDQGKLQWDEAALLSSFDPSFQHFLEPTDRAGLNTTTVLTASLPRWRSVPLDQSKIEVAWPSQDQRRAATSRERGCTDFADHEFLEHSLAFIEHMVSSQIISTAKNDEIDGQDTTFVSFATGTSMTDTTIDSTDGASLVQAHSETPVKFTWAAEITDLKRIPNADHILRIQPQTMTVDLLSGVIAISPSRTVQLRKGKSEREIVEVTVGDETRAGFSIAFWLIPERERDGPSDGLRRTLATLRPGQVVMMRSVALSCFRGNVYGQSLSTRFARNSTTLAVLSDDIHGCSFSHHVAAKLRRVRDWTSDFVGITRHSPDRDKQAGGLPGAGGVLPPDTQD